ncbi:MAG: transglutaminase-like domain-containing protein [Rubrivivax sp.]
MAGRLQFEATTALDFFAALVADDADFPVLEAAVAVAQDEYPELDVQGTLARIDELGEQLRVRMPPDSAPLQRLRLLHPYFFQELGFGGNVNNYYDPANSLVPEVLRTRRGIPITLALIYIEIAASIGLKAEGISFPGHFLVKVQLSRGEIVIDPFDGRSLGRDELEERLQPYRPGGASAGDGALLEQVLQAARPRQVIARMLANLRELYRSAGDRARLIAVQQRLVLLMPQVPAERRELALALAHDGRHAAACDALSRYLQDCPDAGDAAALRQQLRAWQRPQ